MANTTNNPDRPAPQTPEATQRSPETQAFIDACLSMSHEDWDDDNAWLDSAGWGEM